MLPATLKLCCGISHQHLRKLTGLQKTAVGAFGREISRFILDKTNSYFPNILHPVHRSRHRDLGECSKQCLSYFAILLSSRDLCYLNQAEDTLRKAIVMLHQQEGWQTELHLESGEWILSKTFPKIGKVFRAEAVIDSPPDYIYTHLFEKLEDMYKWNPSISKVQVLQKIENNTILTREVTSEMAVNVISQRDFVSVRHCCKKGSSFYLVGTATHSELMPPQKGIIRAEAGLTCIVLQPLDGESKRTHLTWLLSLDLKGWIPKPVTDRTLSQSQADFITCLRNHLAISAETY
ncbi:steroidogenic acute regulatory protein, mitochondrial-like [Spea bombifrons]|uniref:steroidogenic acute regulatory protein, mitochondrial-like n=1 Tax=Spea bombifrons TaxID=233779 RepID=UPI00234A56FC|nr:steroidogenic acute regulatory protein, mitochondrial-like [Spea bombifrons]